MVMDAHTTGQDGKTDYGYYEVQITAVDSQTTVLPYTSWLPKIDHEHEVTIASPTTSEVVITNPGLPGLQFRIPAGAIVTGVDNKPVTRIGLTPVPVARPPFPLPVNVNVPVYFTVQPSGATITGVDGKYVGPRYGTPTTITTCPARAPLIGAMTPSSSAGRSMAPAASRLTGSIMCPTPARASMTSTAP
jgi:hypothetical protein